MPVLLLEDHPEVRHALADLLSGRGLEVLEAGTLEEARALVREALPELVVTDQHLPDGLGSELVLELRGHAPKLAALIITARSDLPVQAPEGVRVLSKPMDLDVFAKEIMRLLAEAGLAPRAPPALSPVQLRFYFSSRSSASMRATIRLRQLLARCDPKRYALELLDFEAGLPARADEDRVMGTPTLVLQHPDGRKSWVVGDLRVTETLELLLEQAGIRLG